MTPAAAAHRIRQLQAELRSIASQPARSASERSEIACRVDELQRTIDLIRNDKLAVGHP